MTAFVSADSRSPCKTTFYCMNTGCQKEHWKVHKLEHRKIQKAFDSVKNADVGDDDTKSGSKNTKTSANRLANNLQKSFVMHH